MTGSTTGAIAAERQHYDRCRAARKAAQILREVVPDAERIAPLTNARELAAGFGMTFITLEVRTGNDFAFRV